MSTVGALRNLIATYMGRTTAADLSATTAGSVDLGLYGLNAARRKIEQARDFHYAETDATLVIGSSGGLLTDAYLGGTVTVAGTLVPNVAGAFTVGGTYGAAPFYIRTTGGVSYFLFFVGTAWRIRAGGFAGTSGWDMTTTGLNPAGSYTATGGSTGAATVTSGTAVLSIKRVNTVALPISGGTLPIEFLTNDEWLDRLRRQAGRTTYSGTATAAELGISSRNPVAYQQGQSLYVVPGDGVTFPITATINVVRFMPDYAQDSDHDFFCDFAPDYLQWQAILEANKFFRRFADKQEGNIDEKAIGALADQALQSLLQWDASLQRGTSTPAEQEPAAAPRK